ncbi:FkbM family methyltransferase [Helicobacter apodemus]|uniref:FkbM family methyltransferase n=1 Tax=Helicobacter apodemus TaxID=135569 RepID=UPI001883F2EE|nr:FkbM family methyltransferase [Helicobacter apodemus]
MKISYHHKTYLKHSSPLKYPKLETLSDYKQALAIKNSLTYRLGEAFIYYYKWWWCGGLWYFFLNFPNIRDNFRIVDSLSRGSEASVLSQDTLQRIKKIEAIADIFWNSKLQGIPFRGQLGQDAIAYVLNCHKKQGFFVDIGAHDGKNISNTYLFEQLGWSGFCVEANPLTFKRLQQNRKCDVYNLAVYSKNIGITKMATSKSDTLDTLEVNLTLSHKKRIEANASITYIEVPTATFDEIMENYPQVSHIDFMSLDVEGGELEVLKGIDFSKYRFSCIAIEHNYFKDAQREVISLLNAKGYRILMWNGWDYLFVPKENIYWNQ